MPIVIDNGSGITKAGDADYDMPEVLLPSVVARSKINPSESWVGELALEKQREGYTLKYPIEHGIVTNWDDMERIWHHLFYSELRVDPSDQLVLLTEAPIGPKANRERMTQIMFETFRVERFYVALTGVLGLYAAGKATGVTLDVGHGVSHVIPIYEGYALPHAIQRVDFGGLELTKTIDTLLKADKQGTTFAEAVIVKKALSLFPRPGERVQETLFGLPRGRVIRVSPMVQTSAKFFFYPGGVNIYNSGFHEVVNEGIMKCDVDIRRTLFSNVVISGGSSVIEGFKEELWLQLQNIVQDTYKEQVRIIAMPSREILTWQGGAILATLTTFSTMWITRDEYNHSGPAIVHRKCF